MHECIYLYMYKYLYIHIYINGREIHVMLISIKNETSTLNSKYGQTW